MTTMTLLGIEKKKRTVIHSDLDHLAGTWSAQESDDFLRATAAFGTVDAEMWK